MHTRMMAWLAALVLLTGGLFATWSLLRGQSPMPPPRAAAPPAAAPTTSTPTASGLVADAEKLPPLQKQMYFSVQSASEWLFGANRDDGRFVYGYLPDVNSVMEGDHYLRQVGAAFALARAARFTGKERYAVRATQAILTLLSETAVDPRDPQVRSTTLPSTVVNRLAAAGLLVLAINELPAPQQDLLQQSEQLCNFIRKQQRADGSLSCGDSPEDRPETEDPEGVNYYPGEALYGLMRSQEHRPAAWKTDVVRKALTHYRNWWPNHKNMAFVPWQTAAYTEAFLRTKEQPFADFVNEMNDWLCGLQYERFDPRRPLWVGGFMSWSDGKVVETPPQVSSASFAEGLAEACRVARTAGDLPHYRRFSQALERCLQFLATLQYTDANTQHFATWYRPRLVGAFHASDQDGNLRIDYTQHAVCAMIQYLNGTVGQR